MMRVMYRWFFALVLILSLFAVGCDRASQPANTGEEPKKTQTETADQVKSSDQAAEVDPEASEEAETSQAVAADWALTDLFGQEIGSSWSYTGMADYLRWETLVNVETHVQSDGKTYYIEGEVEDLSAGEAGDMGFLKVFNVSNKQVIQTLDDQTDLIRLQAPLEVGHTWETKWYAPHEVGAFDATVTITSVDGDQITTKLTPTYDLVPQWRSRYSLETVWEKGKGIVKETESFAFSESGDTTFTATMDKMSAIPYKGFVSRYVRPAQDLKRFFSHPSGWYERTMSEHVTQLYGAKSDGERLDVLRAYLNQFDAFDFKANAQALRMAQIANRLMDEEHDLVLRTVLAFMQDQKDAFNSLAWEDYDWVMKLTELYDYDTESWAIQHRTGYEDLTDEQRIQAIMLKDAGLVLEWEEGYPYFLLDYWTYVKLGALTDQPGTETWLKLQGQAAKQGSYFSDGGLVVSWKALVDRVAAMDAYAHQYPEHWAQEENAQAHAFFKRALMDPGYEMDNTPKYEGLIVREDVLEAYTYAVKTYPDAPFTEILDVLVSTLSTNGGLYTMELNTALQEFGYGYEESDSRLTPLRERMQQVSELEELTGTTTADPDGLETIWVRNVDELVQAIGSNRRIIIEPQLLVVRYFEESEYATRGEIGGIVIRGVENLVIEGNGLTDLLVDDYGLVLSFDDCRHITVRNLRMGHIQAFCRDGVMWINEVDGFTLDQSILFGCGWYGLLAQYSENLHVTGSVIADCETFALRVENTRGVKVDNSQLTRNGRTAIEVVDSTGLLIDSSTIEGGAYELETGKGLLHLSGDTQVLITNSVLQPYGDGKLQSGDGTPAVIQ